RKEQTSMELGQKIKNRRVGNNIVGIRPSGLSLVSVCKPLNSTKSLGICGLLCHLDRVEDAGWEDRTIGCQPVALAPHPRARPPGTLVDRAPQFEGKEVPWVLCASLQRASGCLS